jgi:aerobic carbon-monoxide dehydrogenase medium subunit
MYTNEFDYFRPSHIQEALALLEQHPDAKLLAGGHSLIPTMKLRLAAPSALIDVSALEGLRGIRLEGNTLILGAMTTHRDLEFSDMLQTHCPILPQQASLIGDPMVRNKGTLGGALAHADPAADYPAAMLALGASLKIEGKSGPRVVAAQDFFQGMFATALEPGEMLTEIHIPLQGSHMAYAKFAHPASRYAIVGVAAVLEMTGQICNGARLALTGAGPGVMRLGKIEAALEGRILTAELLSSAVQNAVEASELLSDNFASSEYRAHLVGVMAHRALSSAAGITV